MKRHDSDDSPVAAKLQRFELLKKRYVNVHIIIHYFATIYLFVTLRMVETSVLKY